MQKKDAKNWDAEHVLAIYSAYPRHVARRTALAAIERALTRIFYRGTKKPVEYLLRRTKRYAASPAGQQGEFTPYPATWFNQGRYEDDPGEWQKAEVPKPDRPLPPAYKPTHVTTEAEHVADIRRWMKETGQQPSPIDRALLAKYDHPPNEAAEARYLADYLKMAGLKPTPAQAAWIEKHKDKP